MLRLILAVTFLLAPALASAQDPPIRWGRLTDEEVALSAVADDPDAAAVVLGDVGFGELIQSNGQYRYRLRRHRRVKVLRETAYSEGEFVFHYEEGDRVSDVKGQTFVPEPDGSMRRVDLERGSIFEGEVAAGVRGVRFTMPALAPGAIFEVEYTYETNHFVSLPAWYFQSSEPTLVSEYRFTVPLALNYVALRQGDRIEDRELIRGVGIHGRTQVLRWVAQNVPALRNEPYITTREDYTTKIALQLSSIIQSDGFVDQVLSTWEQVADALADHPEFGRRLESSRMRREVASQVEGTQHERAQALYDYVRTRYVWNGQKRVFAERDLNDVIQSRSGSNGELNLLLLALLKEAGVPAQPVLLSTRSNGRAIPQYPILSQFDRLVVLVEAEGQPGVFLDATDPHLPYGMLPVESLNGAGWVADRGNPVWRSVSAPGGTSRTSLVRAALHEDGQVDGTVSLRLTGYDAHTARTRLAGAAAASGATVADVADVTAGAEVRVLSIEGVEDVSAPLRVEAHVQTAAGDVAADEIYLTPFMVTHLTENPFERSTRAFPVDFAFPFERTYIAEIALPEGYVVEDVPEPIRMTIPSRAVSYMRMIGAEEGRLTVRAVLTVSQSLVQPEEYPSLRDLYDEIVAAESEAVVITRTGGAPVPIMPEEVSADTLPAGGSNQ